MGQTAMTLLQPWPVKSIIDQIIRVVPTAGAVTSTQVGLVHFILGSLKAFVTGTEFDFLYKGIGLLAVIILFNSLFLYMQNIYLTRLGQRVTLEVRSKLFSHLISLPHRFFEESRSGDLTNRISKDTSELQAILESCIIIAVRSLPTIVGILIVAFTLDWIYALTFVFVIPVVYLATSYFSKRTKEAMRLQRRVEGAMASTAQEAIYYHKAVASLSLEGDVTDDLIADGKMSAVRGVQAGRYQGMLTSSVEFMVSLTTAFVLLIGALRILHGCLTVGQLMVFLSYLNSLFKPVRQFSKFMGHMAKSIASNERIEEIMRLNPVEIGAAELPNAIEAPPFRGHILFNKVSFGYKPGQKVLSDFSLKVQAGEKVGIVGDSGCGKTTVISLLMRLYDPQDGEIGIDGMDIRSFSLNSLRAQISTVLQDSYIFEATVKENIGLARSGAVDEEILAAAQAARAHEFIMQLPQAYDTQLGEGGTGLSGGQRRRLAIARAILRNAPVIIMDEPTEGLDAISERQVMETLARLTVDKTSIIVTHQLSTIRNVDHIVVLDKGKVAEEGTHSQLLENGSLYWRFWQNQMGETGSESER
jgi:ATP-binding cassette subfamily B protein